PYRRRLTPPYAALQRIGAPCSETAALGSGFDARFAHHNLSPPEQGILCLATVTNAVTPSKDLAKAVEIHSFQHPARPAPSNRPASDVMPVDGRLAGSAGTRRRSSGACGAWCVLARRHVPSRR